MYGKTPSTSRSQDDICINGHATDVPIETINLGDEGFGFIDVNYVMVIFWKGKILVKIEDTRTEYQGNPTLNNAKNYAEIVAKRIK